MYIKEASWLELSAYLFIDRKIDKSSSTYLKSQYIRLCHFLSENNLPFNRESVNLFVQYKMDSGCKNSYLNNLLRLCQYIHEWLLQKGYDSGCDKLTYFKKETHVYDILLPEEAERIYSVEMPYKQRKEATNLKYQALFMFLTLTGVRLGEALNLRWEDISETTIYIKDTKTNVDRAIPNNYKLYRKLQEYDLIRDKSNPFTFQGMNGKSVTESTVRSDLQERVSYLGITKRVWPHLFRHSFCVEMLKHNDVTLVAKIMGHTSLNSTLAYSHYLLDDMKHAVMTHPLLREVQPFDIITDRILEFVDTIIDKNHNSVHIKKGKDTFSICVKR